MCSKYCIVAFNKFVTVEGTTLTDIANGFDLVEEFNSQKLLRKYLTNILEQNTFQKRSENEQPSWELNQNIANM